MKRSIRIIALLFVLCFCFSLFSGCKPGKGGTSSVDPGTVISTGDVNFVNAEGKSTYRVVRPYSEADMRTACLSVVDALESKFNISVRNITDNVELDGTPEILIGNTTRAETAKAVELLNSEATGRAEEYIICTVGNNIVIYGNNLDSTVAATDYFVANYLTQPTITGGIHYVHKSTASYGDISILGTTRLCDINIVRPIYNVSYITQQQTDKLIEYVLQNTGYEINMVKDQIASTGGNNTDGSGTLTPSAAGEYEIIIGNCLRDGVKTITDENAFEIRVEDKKIYLNGGSPYATGMAVSEFLNIITAKKSVSKEDSVLQGSYSACIGKYDGKTYYRCTWKDDFNGSDIDTSLWHVRWGETAYTYLTNGKTCLRGNKNLKNNYVKDGKLYFEAIETDKAYHGGLITTQSMMEYYMGYVEISTIHPRGEGFWVALFTMSAVLDSDKKNVGYTLDPERCYYNETDVEESYGGGTWVFGNTFCWPTAYGKEVLADANGKAPAALHVNNRLTSKDDRGFWMDFHTYGFENLDATKVSYTCDGNVWGVQELREGAEQYSYDQSVFLRLGMAVSSIHQPLSTNAEDWQFYNKYIVDYIHVYQHTGDILYTKKLNELNWNKTVIK